jgi:LSD1 subclass zinc finger protein
MPHFHSSGTLLIACAACRKENELTAINLPGAESIMCSYCHAPLGAWQVLLARSEDDKAGSAGRSVSG